MYPLSDFILKRMEELNIKKTELVRRLGYKDISKGVVKFNSFLNNFDFNPFILKNLAKALEVREFELKEKIFQTIDIVEKEEEEEYKRKKEEERKKFQPFLHVKTTNSYPSSIMMCALRGAFRFKRITLSKGILEKPFEEQKEIIKKIIKDFVAEHKGKIDTFGDITGFVYRRYFEEEPENRIFFNISGEIEDCPAEEKTIHIGECSIHLSNGKEVTRLFNKFFNRN